ncbi:hypothetical protein [Dokdonia sp.]|uniref:hypothetical protein n=1 Tax=Dokdonia sp. TaxID=2024995 RepID=UPI0032658B61
MKFNPLRDWHFTLSMECPFEQANVFLNCLDIINWQNTNHNALKSAIEQLNLLDDYYKIYAYPQILTVLFEVKDTFSRKIINDFCIDFLAKINASSFHNLYNEKNKNHHRLYKELSEINESEKLDNYQDIYQYKETTVLLSYLYINLKSNLEFKHDFQTEYEEEEEENNPLKNLINNAYSYQYGRLAFIIAARIIRLIDFENYKSGINDQIFKYVSYRDIHINPDLTELIIDAQYFDIEEEYIDDHENDEVDEIDEIDEIGNQKNNNDKSHIITSKIKEEFYDLVLFNRLSERNKDENNYYFQQLKEPIKSNTTTSFSLRKKALKITYWQFNLLNTFFLRDPKISLEFFASTIIEPEHNINFQNLPIENQNVTAIYSLKNIYKWKNENHIDVTIDEIKKQVYSPLPRISLNKPGILFNDPTWFQNSEDPFLYFRTSIFGYLGTQYLSFNQISNSQTFETLLKLSTISMRFHKEYWGYIKNRDHKAYHTMLNMKKEGRHRDNSYIVCYGSEKQISIQRLFYERIKGISSLPNINVYKWFYDKTTSTITEGYQLLSSSNYSDLYFNVILPNSIFFWITQTYLSDEIENKKIGVLKLVINHEVSLKNLQGKKFYGVATFIKNQLSCLHSFSSSEKDISDYSKIEYSPLKLDLTASSPRCLLSASTEEELKRLINTPNKNKNGSSLLLHKAIRIIYIINKENIYDEYEETVDTSLKDLEKELSAVFHEVQLDRYVRLQLIHSLNNKLLLKSENDIIRELIVYLILEYGGIYDIDLLFDTLFTTSKNELKQQLLQKKIIYGFYTLLKNKTTERGLITSPYNALYQKNKIAFIQKKLTYLALNFSKNPLIKDSLIKNNETLIHFLYGEKNHFNQEPITTDADKYLKNVDQLQAIYHDRNNYSTNIVFKQKKDYAKTYNNKKIKIKVASTGKWNSIDFLQQSSYKKEIENHEDSQWLVDIIGIKQNIHNDTEYTPITYQIASGVSNPYPLSLFEFICEITDPKKEIRFVLLYNNYTNPITGKKGDLWSYAIGKNVFIEKNQYEITTLENIDHIFEVIRTKYSGIKNATKGLILYFTINDDGTKMSMSEKLFSELKENITIKHDLLPTIKTIYKNKEKNKWVANLKNNNVSNLYSSEINIDFNHPPIYEEEIVFDISEYSWNPFIEVIKKIPQKKSEPLTPSSNGKKLPEKGTGTPPEEPIQPPKKHDLNSEKLNAFLDYNQLDKPNLKAKIDAKRNITLIDYYLPADLRIPTSSNTKWVKTFHPKTLSSQINISHLSPNTYNSTFFKDYDQGYNAFLELRVWKNGLYISTSKIKPYDLQSFSKWFSRLNAEEQKRFQLTYIGIYDTNDYKFYYNSTTELKEYLFEFGYGRVIILDETQIKIHTTSIANYKSIIFYGDKFTNIKIDYDKNTNSNKWITTRKIDFFTSRIYNESLRKNVIHTLHINSRTKEIIKVVSTNSRSDLKTNNVHKNQRKVFKLSEESKEILENEHYQTDEIILYAKVEEQTNGSFIEFNIVQLSNDTNTLHNKLMFFKAENIYYENNIYKLKILPLLDNVPEHNVSTDFLENCFIKKRDFSSEANTLMTLYNERLDKSKETSELVKDELFLVHLSYDNNKGKYHFSLIGTRDTIRHGRFNMPIRHESSLNGMLEKGNITAVVINHDRHRNKYRVELKPGIFIEIGIINKKYFKHGDVVKIKKEKDGIIFKMVIPSDIRFFQGTKLISILPKNDIHDIDPNSIDDSFYTKDYFIASEFANIELKLKKTHKLVHFLQQKDKNALINNFVAKVDINQNFRYKQVEILFKNNYLVTKNNSLLVHFSNKNYEIWGSQLSFQEKQFSIIKEQFLNSSWRYIDQTTQIWENDHWKSVSISNKRYNNSIITSFLNRRDNMTFRFPFHSNKKEIDVTELSKISLPTASLVYHLKNQKERTTDVTIVCEYENKLFIEVLPTRIVEIQSDYLKFKNSTLGMNNIPKGLLGTGDRLKLKLKIVNYYNYELDSVEVLEWIPSGRSSFNEKAILPFVQSNMGLLKFGKGKFEIKIPQVLHRKNQTTDRKEIRAIDTTSNYHSRVDKIKNITSCTTLLYIENNTLRLTTHLYIDYKIIVKGEDSFLNQWFTTEHVKQLIDTAGGYIPVTVDSINDTIKEIYISRDYQLNKVPQISNKRNVIVAIILGKLDEDTLLLKSGPLLLNFRIQDLIPYIPKEVITDSSVLKSLSELLRNRFYITQNEENFIHGINIKSQFVHSNKNNDIDKTTIDSQQQKDLDCELVKPVSIENHEGIIIFNQVDMTLHYVNYKDISWIRPLNGITKIQLIKHIVRGQYDKKLKIHIDTESSFIHTQLATTEFDSLHNGKTITIEYIKKLEEETVVHPTEGYSYHLVRSKTSNIAMLAESNLDNDSIKNINLGLVIDYSKKDKTVLIAIGEKRIVIDTYLKEFSNSDYSHIDIKNKYIEELKAISKNDLEKYNSIGQEILNTSKLSVFIPLYYLKTTYDIIKQNLGNGNDHNLRNTYISVIKDMAIRAMRERHSEIIISKWLHSDDTKKKVSRLWNRINHIGEQVFNDTTSEINKDLFRAIENLNNIALPLRSSVEKEGFIEISKALMIAIGQNNGIILSNTDTPIVSSLIELGLKAFKNGSEDHFFKNKSNLDEIENIIKTCNTYGYFYLRDNLIYSTIKNLNSVK